MKQTSKFKIGLDYRMAKHTGIGTYLRGVARGIQRGQLIDPADLAYFATAESALIGTSSCIYFDAPIYSIAEQFAYRQLIPLCRLWHSPHYNVPVVKNGTKLVVTIHDVIHWIYRKSLRPTQRLYAEVMLRRATSLADRVITVSEHSKKDLVCLFNVNPDKVTVIHNGVDPDFYPADSAALESAKAIIAEKYGVTEPFLLYVGMLKSHKNVIKLMQVFLRLRAEKKIKSGLVIIGQGAEGSPEVKLLKDSSDQVKHLPRIEFGDLRFFYQAATALVHPSLYEGFGLTILEAMACGTPALTTRRASLPEVAGDAALYMDGDDETEMAARLIEIESDESLRKRLSEAGLLQACRFSWDKAARETTAVYEKVLNL